MQTEVIRALLATLVVAAAAVARAKFTLSFIAVVVFWAVVKAGALKKQFVVLTFKAFILVAFAAVGRTIQTLLLFLEEKVRTRLHTRFFMQTEAFVTFFARVSGAYFTLF